MALESVCGTLRNGQDNSCLTSVQRKYEQQLVLINRSDIDYTTVVYTDPTEEECNYNVQFSLKDGKTGYRITSTGQGTSIKGFYNKTVNETTGMPQYSHQVQMLLMGVDEETKCILAAIDKALLVPALQIGSVIEIYGIGNGLTSADYTWDVTENGGGTLIVLNSLEANPEARLPLVYKSATPGSEIADFDSNFDNGAPSV